MSLYNKKNILLTIAFGLALLLPLLLNSNHAHNDETYLVQEGNITQSVDAVGQIVPKNYSIVKTVLSGQVNKVLVKTGEYVKKGQYLAEIKTIPTIQNLLQAQNNINITQQNLAYFENLHQRYKKLLSKSNVARSEYDAWKWNYEKAKHELQFYKDLQGYLRGYHNNNSLIDLAVRSPVDGFVAKIYIRPGDTVEPTTDSQSGEPLFLIVDMDSLYFRGVISQNDSNKLSIGQKADLTLFAIPDKKLNGYLSDIALISNLATKDNVNQGLQKDLFKPNDPYNNGIEIDISAINFNKQKLIIGYQGVASITVAKINHAIIIPLSYLNFDESGQTFVYLLKNNQRIKIYVQIGASDNKNIEILKGLKAGDQIIFKI